MRILIALFFALSLFGCGEDDNMPKKVVHEVRVIPHKTTIPDTKPKDPESKPPVVVPPVVTGKTETCHTSSHGNNDQDNCRFTRPGGDYGINIRVNCDGYIFTVSDGGKRTISPRGDIWKPVSEKGPLVIVGPPHVTINSCKVN